MSRIGQRQTSQGFGRRGRFWGTDIPRHGIDRLVSGAKDNPTLSVSSRWLKQPDDKPMMTIDELPLDWFFRPGVKLDFRTMPDGHVVTAVELEPAESAELVWKRAH
jgi:hypothetical protein